MKEIAESQMPPSWKLELTDEIRTNLMKKQATTPIPWLLIMFTVICTLVLLEAAYCVFLRLRQNRTASLGAYFIAAMTLLASESAESQIVINSLGYANAASTSHLSFEINSRTSIQLAKNVSNFDVLNRQTLKYPWLWVRRVAQVVDATGSFRRDVVNWIKKGGFLVIENMSDKFVLEKAIQQHFAHHSFTPKWMPIPPDHEMMRSFYLLDSLPQCQGNAWQGFVFDGRLAILVIPFRFLETLMDNPISPQCQSGLSREQSVRTFVNILMVALATDYKKDQIHLPEILKRLR